jgi:hypothetical protein
MQFAGGTSRGETLQTNTPERHHQQW